MIAAFILVRAGTNEQGTRCVKVTTHLKETILELVQYIHIHVTRQAKGITTELLFQFINEREFPIKSPELPKSKVDCSPSGTATGRLCGGVRGVGCGNALGSKTEKARAG